MRSKDMKSANRDAYKRGSNGRLSYCSNCGKKIHIWQDKGGKVKLFESWVEQNCDVGEFVPHYCGNYGGNVENNKYTRHNYQTDQQHECPNCHLLMPKANKTCDNCGAKL